ncbi:MAG: alanyl-tRNA editing protein [Methanomassiliicoccales archaeon]|nr:MAG: alanyl-tRNA editing protein [Methanomassiliicoccales archaeon]
MTELLYMNDIEGNYVREFDAKVVKKKDNYVVLDKSAFYPLGGGQPSDTGVLKWQGGESRVAEVQKKGIIKHIISGELPEGDVHGILDWEKRYAHMKMHTAQHVISGVVYDLFNARTVGNQIHAEYSRVDFYPISLSDEDLKKIEDASNEVIGRNSPVNIYEEGRDSLEKRTDPLRSNLDLIPSSIKNLRIVEIEGFDVCPCAGTHVKTTKELGRLKITKKENKGKDRERIVYTLE